MALALSDFLSEFLLDVRSASVELKGSSPGGDGDSSEVSPSADV